MFDSGRLSHRDWLALYCLSGVGRLNSCHWSDVKRVFMEIRYWCRNWARAGLGCAPTWIACLNSRYPESLQCFYKMMRKRQKVKTVLWAVTASKTSVLTYAKKQACHRRCVAWRCVSSFPSPLPNVSHISAFLPALPHRLDETTKTKINSLRSFISTPVAPQDSNLNPFTANSLSGPMNPKRPHKASEAKGHLLSAMNLEESSMKKAGWIC